MKKKKFRKFFPKRIIWHRNLSNEPSLKKIGRVVIAAGGGGGGGHRITCNF
jgi:hypothetical protein